MARMKCSGTIANLFRMRLWFGGREETRRAGEGLRKGLKGGLAVVVVVVVVVFEGGGLGLLAREGENRSWNWGELVNWEKEVGKQGETNGDGVDVEEGDLGGVEVDVAVCKRFVECCSNKSRKIGRHRDRCHCSSGRRICSRRHVRWAMFVCCEK